MAEGREEMGLVGGVGWRMSGWLGWRKGVGVNTENKQEGLNGRNGGGLQSPVPLRRRKGTHGVSKHS